MIEKDLGHWGLREKFKIACVDTLDKSPREHATAFLQCTSDVEETRVKTLVEHKFGSLK